MSKQATTLPKGFRGDMANGFNPRDADHLSTDAAAHVARRQRLLGPAYRLFYKTPVEISRAKGVFLYDKHGNEYLDAYNNVVSLGHAHPRVVEAIQKQLETLCTHTRYMQEPLLDYAETLINTFAGDLGRTGCAMFTCTGSEANDLALRIARYHTGRRGVIVTAEAYHGNSGAVAAISPSLGKKSALDPYLRTVAAPDSYRLPAVEIGRRMAEDVARQIADLERHGDGVAAFIADSVFSSDGLYVDPTDVLAPVAEVVRKAGGIFIADEVQSGFGRTGTWFAADLFDVVPDLMTFAKGVNSGYVPLGGVAVSPAIAETFARRPYPGGLTYSGHPLACAAAVATIGVMEEEGVVAHAATLGGTLIGPALRELAERHPSVGEVRGTGMFWALELVRNKETREPLVPYNATGEANAPMLAFAAAAKANGLWPFVNMNRTHVVPPCNITEAEAKEGLAALDAALSVADEHTV